MLTLLIYRYFPTPQSVSAKHKFPGLAVGTPRVGSDRYGIDSRLRDVANLVSKK